MDAPDRSRLGSPKGELAALRAINLLVLVLFASYGTYSGHFERLQWVLLLTGALAASLIGVLVVPADVFERKRFRVGVLASDVTLTLVAMHLAGALDADLMVAFFLIVFLSSFGQSMLVTLAFTAVAALIHVYIVWKGTPEMNLLDTAFLIRLPFLFVTALFSAYLAAQSRSERLSTLDALDRSRGDVASRNRELEKKARELLDEHARVLKLAEALRVRNSELEQKGTELAERDEKLLATNAELEGRTDELAKANEDLKAREAEVAARHRSLEQAMVQLARSHREVTLLYEVARALLPPRDPSQMLPPVVLKLADAFQAKRAAIWIALGDGRVAPAAHHGEDARSSEPLALTDEADATAVSGPAIEEGRVVFRRDEPARPGAGHAWTPVWSAAGELAGLIELRRAAEAPVLVTDDLRLLETVARQVSASLEQHELTRRLASTVARLTEMDTWRAYFLREVSQELRAPINFVRAFATSLLKDRATPLPPEQQESLEIIQTNLARVREWIGDFLEVSRAEAGELIPSPEDVSPSEVVAKAVAARSALLRERGVGHTTRAAPAGSIRADGAILERLVRLLLTHAAGRTARGGAIETAIETGAKGWSIVVRDGGEVPDTSRLERIFDREAPASSDAAGRTGSGLGLPACRALARSMGASLSARPRLAGAGLEYRLELPAG